MMTLRKRFKQNINKALAVLNVTVSDDAVKKIAEAAFGIATNTSVRWDRLESIPNNHESRKTNHFVTSNCPKVVDDLNAFIKKCITESVIKEARDAISAENAEKRSYNRIIDIAKHHCEDIDKKVDVLYKSYVNSIAKEYAKRDAQKIFDAAKEHFLKQR